jgi:hypothetical protein
MNERKKVICMKGFIATSILCVLQASAKNNVDRG